MYESLLKNTAEYQKISASLAAPGPAALFVVGGIGDVHCMYR